jgi:hypothetical protein
MKSCSISLGIRKMQIKTAAEYHCVSMKRTKTFKKKVATLNTGKDAKKLDCSYIAGRNVKLHRQSGKQFGNFL